MSREQRRVSLADLAPPICEFCGTTIEEPDRDCPALDEGVCAP